LIPDHKTSSVYFTDYKTLNELILDVKTKIDEDKFNDLGKLDENEDEFDTSSLNSVKDITDIVKDDMVKVAQKQYDDWKQDQNGQDETGGGYSWKKIPDVEFNRNDIVINRLSSDPSEYNNYVETI